MFGLGFRFPTGRYHATAWYRNVNEASVAWPPEPWRILRALIACYWRKGDHDRWNEDVLSRLVDALAEKPPVFCLPSGAIHSHTRHYMPIRSSKTLVFDAFLHLPAGTEIEVRWEDLVLEDDLLELSRDLAASMGYLGRAESWSECRAFTSAIGEPNCFPSERASYGDTCHVLVPHSPRSYQAERKRLQNQEAARIRTSSSRPLSDRALNTKVEKSFRATGGVDTLPPRLLDALSIDTADLQNRKWNQPPGAYEVMYSRSPNVRPRVRRQSSPQFRKASEPSDLPTVARYLVAGRPLPRIEDAVKIGEVLRSAALSKFGWETCESTGKRYPLAPWKISGRDTRNMIVRDPTHPHAFWLPEDADNDGWIDHLIVFIAGGIDRQIQSQLDRVNRLWLTKLRGQGKSDSGSNIGEWSLALEGFGGPMDFGSGSRMLATSRRWRSVTPFMAAGFLKKKGYAGEVLRLLARRGGETKGVAVRELPEIVVAGAPRRTLNFHRFRSRGREVQRDSTGAFLEIEFPEPIRGPLALGYACHYGLGSFKAVQ